MRAYLRADKGTPNRTNPALVPVMGVGAFLEDVAASAVGAIDLAFLRVDAQENARVTQRAVAAVAGNRRRFDVDGFGGFGHDVVPSFVSGLGDE